MYLVLCSQNDRPALWAYHKLRAAGLDSIELVTASSLASSKSWEHRLCNVGVELKVELQDGRRLFSSEIDGVLNRLIGAPTETIAEAVAEDREYAAAESTAFYLGWLQSLRGVINAPSPQGLCGAWRHTSEWVMLGARAGLKTQIFRQTSVDMSQSGFQSLAPPDVPVRNVIVLRDQLYAAAVPRALGEACRKLATVADTDLLGVDLFESGNGELLFGHATPFPDLTLGGDELIEGLVRVFRAL